MPPRSRFRPRAPMALPPAISLGLPPPRWAGAACTSEYIRHHGLRNFMIESIFDQAIEDLPAFLLAVETKRGGARLTGYEVGRRAPA
jgi:hypothetical protein